MTDPTCVTCGKADVWHQHGQYCVSYTIRGTQRIPECNQCFIDRKAARLTGPTPTRQQHPPPAQQPGRSRPPTPETE